MKTNFHTRLQAAAAPKSVLEKALLEEFKLLAEIKPATLKATYASAKYGATLSVIAYCSYTVGIRMKEVLSSKGYTPRLSKDTDVCSGSKSRPDGIDVQLLYVPTARTLCISVWGGSYD